RGRRRRVIGPHGGQLLVEDPGRIRVQVSEGEKQLVAVLRGPDRGGAFIEFRVVELPLGEGVAQGLCCTAAVLVAGAEAGRIVAHALMVRGTGGGRVSQPVESVHGTSVYVQVREGAEKHVRQVETRGSGDPVVAVGV